MAGLGPACEGCCGQTPVISYPVERLDPETFSFEFQNLVFAYGRRSSYLCFQVEREQHSSPVPSDRGVFKNQESYHAEPCFLTWFCAKKLSPDERYDVTWFLSWSPCATCAEEIASFLKNHRNVRLRIFVSRIYEFQKQDVQKGLRELNFLEVQMDAMFLDGFKYCWENFVHNQGKPFECWENLSENSQFMSRKLKEILSTGLLSKQIFNYQFGNQLRGNKSEGRRKTYLCYKLKLPDETLDKGYFMEKKKKHAEICFIDKISNLDLDPKQSYEITCYITWSPCLGCAKKLAALVEDCPQLRLRIFTSRLRYHWCWPYKEGLRHLQKFNIPVLVMKEPEFADCWDNFVDNQGGLFQPWKKLTQYSNSIERRLRKILQIHTMALFSEQSSGQSQDLKDLADALKRLFLDVHRPRD